MLILYYATPSEVALRKFPDLSWRGIALNLVAWTQANAERGYMGIGNCNALAEHWFRHYPADFVYDRQGWLIEAKRG